MIWIGIIVWGILCLAIAIAEGGWDYILCLVVCLSIGFGFMWLGTWIRCKIEEKKEKKRLRIIKEIKEMKERRRQAERRSQQYQNFL